MAKVSAFYRHVERVYATMLKDAVTSDNGDALFTGHPTQLMSTLGLPSSYYAKILRSLERMGCITRVRRGARNAPSVVALHKQPTPEDYVAIVVKQDNATDRANANEEKVIRDQQIRDLAGRVERLELAVERLSAK